MQGSDECDTEDLHGDTDPARLRYGDVRIQIRGDGGRQHEFAQWMSAPREQTSLVASRAEYEPAHDRVRDGPTSVTRAVLVAF